MKKVFLILILFWSSSAFSQARIGNGGNETAIDFLRSAHQMLSIFGNELKTFPELKKHNLSKVLEETSILVSTTPLHVELRGKIQEVTAINFQNPKTIIIHEARWKNIKLDAVKEALALHELLSLIGIEKTGSYYISKNYLVKNGIHCVDDLCEEQVRQNSDEVFCRFQNNWYPNSETNKFRFLCKGKKSEFTVYCDLWKDPVEFEGNKINALGGVWAPRDKKGGMLNYTYPDVGGKYCTYQDVADE